MKVSLARTLSACIAVFWVISCPAAVVSDPNALTLSEALQRTLAGSPLLAAFVPQTAVAREQAAMQALSPATSLELQFENFAGSGDLSGVQALESTLQLSRALELGDKARVRRDVGDLELEHLDVTQRARQADVVAEVARRFIQVVADQEQLQAIRRTAALAAEALDVVRARVDAGAASPTQVSRAEIAVARAHIAQEHAEHALAASRVALAVLWGEQAPAFSEASGALFEFDTLEAFEDYVRRLDNNPELLSFVSGQRVLDGRLRLAEAQRRPNLTFSIGIRRLEALDDEAMVAGIAWPLGTNSRAQGEIRAANSERELLAFNGQSRRLELHSTLFGLYQEVLHARSEAEALQLRIRPQAQEMLRTTQSGYRAGRFSFLELADAHRQLLEIEQDAIRAAAQFHTQLIEIERLTGQSVQTLVGWRIQMKKLFMTVLVAIAISACDAGNRAVPDEDLGHADSHSEDAGERGPHGGRLLEAGEFALELAIIEAGVLRGVQGLVVRR